MIDSNETNAYSDGRDCGYGDGYSDGIEKGKEIIGTIMVMIQSGNYEFSEIFEYCNEQYEGLA